MFMLITENFKHFMQSLSEIFLTLHYLEKMWIETELAPVDAVKDKSNVRSTTEKTSGAGSFYILVLKRCIVISCLLQCFIKTPVL